MESWDDDNFVPSVAAAAAVAAAANKWVGEDEEEEVKDCWEDEDEEAAKAAEAEKKDDALPAPAKNKKKNLSDKIAERERQRLAEIEQKMKEQEEEEEMTPEEKMRRQKESDLHIALETTFGGSNSSGLDSMAPTTKEEFDEFGDAFLKKVRPLSNSPEYFAFAENLIRNLCATLTSNDIKKIKTTIDNLVLEKQKIEKGDKGKKNKGKGKAKLKLDNENQYSAYVDDFVEYDDFM